MARSGKLDLDDCRDRPIAFYSKLILKKYTQRTGNPQVIGPMVADRPLVIEPHSRLISGSFLCGLAILKPK